MSDKNLIKAMASPDGPFLLGDGTPTDDVGAALADSAGRQQAEELIAGIDITGTFTVGESGYITAFHVSTNAATRAEREG